MDCLLLILWHLMELSSQKLLSWEDYFSRMQISLSLRSLRLQGLFIRASSMSTHTLIAGVAIQHSSITHSHLGISAQLPSRINSSERTRKLIGIQRRLRLVAMAIGLQTILTGRFRVIVIGAPLFQFGDARTSTKFASHP